MSSYSELILSHGPSNYWKLNESSGLTAVDSAGSAPGTLSGGVTLAQPGALADGTTAMLFDGTTSKIVTPAAAVTTPCTVEAWVKTTATGAMPIWCTPYSGTQQEFALQVTTGFPNVNLSTAGQAQLFDLASATSIADGAWHHLVWTFAAGTAVALYLDGVLNKSGTCTFALAGMTLAMEIGYRSDGASYWLGSMDEVAIYPRALTPTEISEHYAARLLTGAPPLDGCDHTTVWHYHLEPLLAPKNETERATLATLYGMPGGSDLSTLVSRYLQNIGCGGPSMDAASPEPVQTAVSAVASSETLTLTFPGATGNGRGLVVGVIAGTSSALPAGACSDNNGNTYTRVLSQAGTGSALAVYLCAKGVGGPIHEVSISPGLGAIELMATAIEVRGVGAGLAVDASGSTTGTSSTPSISSGAVTTTGILGLALAALDAAQTSLVVSTTDGHSGWVELAEDLT